MCKLKSYCLSCYLSHVTFHIITYRMSNVKGQMLIFMSMLKSRCFLTSPPSSPDPVSFEFIELVSFRRAVVYSWCGSAKTDFLVFYRPQKTVIFKCFFIRPFVLGVSPFEYTKLWEGQPPSGSCEKATFKFWIWIVCLTCWVLVQNDSSQRLSYIDLQSILTS